MTLWLYSSVMFHVEHIRRPGWATVSRSLPHPVARLLTGRLEKARIAVDTVIMDILAIRHIRHLRVTANAKSATRTSLDEIDRHLLPFQLRLAEAAAKQLGRNTSILLAELHLQALALAMDNTGLGWSMPAKQAIAKSASTFIPAATATLSCSAR